LRRLAVQWLRDHLVDSVTDAGSGRRAIRFDVAAVTMDAQGALVVEVVEEAF
jgi:hypothetical protein